MELNLFLLVTICSVLNLCNCGKVLFLPAVISPSHKFALATLADALEARNHHVHWWSPVCKLDTYQPKNITYTEHFEVDVDDRLLMDSCRYENDTESSRMDWISEYADPALEVAWTYFTNPFCESVLKHHRHSFDKIVKQQWDLIILDELFSSCGYLVSQLTKAPTIVYVSTCRRTTEAIRRNRDVVPLGYIPGFRAMWKFNNPNTFYQRTLDAISWVVGSFMDKHYFDILTNNLRKYVPNINTVSLGTDRPEFQFVCVPQNLDFPTPTVPNVVYIGGIYKPTSATTLPVEYSSAIDSSSKGFIIVTMGHWAHWEVAPKHFLGAFVEALNNLSEEYTIFWQYDGYPVKNLATNVKVNNWLPQKALLAHPKCKLFVTHCGCNGLIEAIQNRVPMVAIPLTADQPDNAIVMAQRGFGVYLSKTEITAKTLHNAIVTVLNNDMYRKTIGKFSDMMDSEIMNALQRGIYWSEYTMRHKTKNFYKSSKALSELTWFKYYSIDICLLLFSISFAVVFIIVVFIYNLVLIMKRFKDASNATI